ncbi:Coenzyme F420 hydrogenase/dehydrogenase, beta subunit C-terminal domain [Arthrobacter sp. CJ23]|uniref:Coenzyme F420 hydrogenase/dehydrogenase, beta subunit C-terminal domain n=1 Tax=Arthrobacter sp. CJ23 TaxID=2972479 RepID=UPI00215BA3ED|nr:Coenzyme F420 hydrogenase/dehydrogenase, beta subunit C-terminal domain [Arthrobacter sp. CJ23]UVJ38737.1 Coenzyme F420 hydrogenase/dehydrogenase, beta subunit C-terminal domain [Arthrobacter sp. CJ23]
MSHPVFGSYFGVWTGFATDDEVRFSASSGGVLTALSVWLLESRRATQVTGVGAQVDAPSRSVPVRIMSREEAVAASGSRYAPVANASQYDHQNSKSVFVGKPCEAYAASQFGDAQGQDGPVRLSFFCAGTPSQLATDRLIEKMGGNPDGIKSLRYRGNGWPGYFRFEDETGEVSQVSYDDSWGKHLGRDLQWRCKVCVDGTGEFADIAVGDYWETDSKGYPSFSDSEGNSVVIARTARGLNIVEEAVSAGVLILAPANMDALMTIQPLQRIRRTTMVGRLAGRILGGRPVPIYRGFGLLGLAVASIRQNTRATAGTFLRTVRGK